MFLEQSTRCTTAYILGCDRTDHNLVRCVKDWDYTQHKKRRSNLYTVDGEIQFNCGFEMFHMGFHLSVVHERFWHAEVRGPHLSPGGPGGTATQRVAEEDALARGQCCDDTDVEEGLGRKQFCSALGWNASAVWATPIGNQVRSVIVHAFQFRSLLVRCKMRWGGGGVYYLDLYTIIAHDVSELSTDDICKKTNAGSE